MAAALPQSTLHSSDYAHSSRILIGGLVGIAVGILAGLALGGRIEEGGHYVSERGCQPQFEWCAPKNEPWLPEGSENGPANPPGKSGTRPVVTTVSTLSPTTARMLLTDK